MFTNQKRSKMTTKGKSRDDFRMSSTCDDRQDGKPATSIDPTILGSPKPGVQVSDPPEREQGEIGDSSPSFFESPVRRSPSRASPNLQACTDGSEGVPIAEPLDNDRPQPTSPKNTSLAIRNQQSRSSPVCVDSDDDEFSERAVTKEWVETKTYHYLVHPVQPFIARVGTVLRGLRIKRDGGWLPLFPEHGQVVKVSDREFILILCLQVKNKLYRAWIHDGSQSFVCAPKDLQCAVFLKGEAKHATKQSRMKVVVVIYSCVIYVVMHLASYIFV